VGAKKRSLNHRTRDASGYDLLVFCMSRIGPLVTGYYKR